MQANPSATLMQLILTILLGGGLPLGTPPEPEQATMGYAAPEDTLFYSSWASMAVPNPQSKNHTEQLLAEPEVKKFGQSLQTLLVAVLGKNAAADNSAESKLAAKYTPLWTEVLITRATAIYVSPVKEKSADGVPVAGGMVIHALTKAAELEKSLTEIIAQGSAKPTEISILGKKFHRVILPDSQGLALEWGVAGDYFFVGVGAGTLEQVAARIKAKQTPAWLTELKTRLPIERRSMVSHVDLQGIITVSVQAAGPAGFLAGPVIQSLGLRQMKALDSTGGLDENGCVTKTLLKVDGPPKRLLALLDGASLKPTDLNFMPTSSLAAGAISLDLNKVLDAAKEIAADLGGGSGNPLDQGLMQADAVLGMSVTRDLLPALGDTWTMHVSMPAGGTTPDVVASIEIKEMAKIMALEAKLTLMAGNAANIQKQVVAGQNVSSIALPPQAGVSAVCWCITKDRLIVATSLKAIEGTFTQTSMTKRLSKVPALAQAMQASDGRVIGVFYSDAAKAFEQTYQTVKQQMDAAGALAGDEMAQLVTTTIVLPSLASVKKHLQPTITIAQYQQDGLLMESHNTIPSTSVTTAAPVLVALTLPAVQQARNASRRFSSGNNLRQIAISFHNFHDTYKGLPAAYSTDKAGKPLLSWRVAILPYIEQQALYDQFHHDEPWDSDHNKKLIEKMPAALRSPNSASPPGTTTYLGIAGKDKMLVPPADDQRGNKNAKGISFAAVTDGTSNTIMLAEVSDASAVIWTKPDDLEIDPKDPAKGLLVAAMGGTNIAMADGSVRFIKLPGIDPQQLLNLFIRNDGKAVTLP